MDKETLSNYGWIVICTLVLAVMIALATPFGEYVKDAVWSTTNGLNDTLNKNMEIAGLSGSSDDEGADNSYTFYPTEMGLLEQSFELKEGYVYNIDILYNDGTTKTIKAMACYQEKGVIGIYNEFDDGYFVLYNNYDIIETDNGSMPAYTEGKSIYVLSGDDDQIVSATIDFRKGEDYLIKHGAFFIDSIFLSWEELKSEYGITDTTIPEKTFEKEDLLSIVIPEGVTTIDNYAFNRAHLMYVKLPNTLTTIGNYAFCRSDFINITIPDSVTSVGDFTFSECYYLTNIKISNNVKSIGNNAFATCSNLESITIPDSVTNIGSNAFYSCTSLTNVTLSSNLKTISGHTFSRCKNLESITIPDSVTTIETYAFQDCDKLTEIILHDNITSIGDSAFAYCDGLEKITLSSSITTIDSYAFHDCKNVKNITFKGTMAQWNNITKNYGWNQGMLVTQVACSDGTVAL